MDKPGTLATYDTQDEEKKRKKKHSTIILC